MHLVAHIRDTTLHSMFSSQSTRTTRFSRRRRRQGRIRWRGRRRGCCRPGRLHLQPHRCWRRHFSCLLRRFQQRRCRLLLTLMLMPMCMLMPMPIGRSIPVRRSALPAAAHKRPPPPIRRVLARRDRRVRSRAPAPPTGWLAPRTQARDLEHMKTPHELMALEVDSHETQPHLQHALLLLRTQGAS